MTEQREPIVMRYTWVDVITLALCTLLAGADDWVEVAAFGC